LMAQLNRFSIMEGEGPQEMFDRWMVMWDIGTPGSPPTRLTTVTDKWVWPTRRPADMLVGPTDLIGGPHDLLKTF
jgi:hypothetical protein